ncbi:MAG: Blue-light-activated protein [Fibrobacteres bacterium]|nr:Blue-light-activated protein [Fibrobacterota bacterium]
MQDPKTILVVDDQDSIVQLAKTILYMEGYTVIFGCSGEDALFVNANHPFPIHLLLTDIRMSPDLNGCDLAQAMRVLRPDIRVLYMSAFTDDERMAREVETGAAGFLPKPFSPSVLVAKVAGILAGTGAPASDAR